MFFFFLFICSITQDTTSDELLDTSLHIISIQTHQYGEYICEAKNFLGTTNVSILVSGKYIIISKIINIFF